MDITLDVSKLDARLRVLRARVNASMEHLQEAMKDACPGNHKFVQHRDRENPWCEACGLSATGVRIRPPKHN